MELTVGTDSTWSLRVWLCSQIAHIDLAINVIDLTAPDYKSLLIKQSPTGLVPALNQGSFIIHDSLSITEYFNERSDGALYPSNSADRALARSLCAELHAGFINLRTQCPFTLAPVTPLSEQQSLAGNQGITNELKRIENIFGSARLPFMFDSAGAVDAYYAILAYRLHTYGITLKGQAGLYQESLLNWSLLKQAITLAKNWKAETNHIN